MKLIKLWEADFDRAYELQNTFVQDENGFINAAYGFSREEFQEYVKLRKQNSEGVNLPEGFVPDTVYLLETEGEYVGIFNLRHRLKMCIRDRIMPDHVHILMEVDPQFGIHKAVKSLKGYTSKVLRNEYPSLKTRMPSLWTNSYFASTVGGAPLDVIKQYIENQKTSQRQKDKLG